MKALIELNGKKTEIEITVEQAENLGLIEKKTGWERVTKNEQYFINADLRRPIYEKNDKCDQNYYDRANYFSTNEKAEQIDKIQTLWRKMQRFADENNEGELDWENREQQKYFIFYDYSIKRLRIDFCNCCEYAFGIYFTSIKIAEKALEIFGDELKEVLNIEKKKSN